MDYRTSGGRLPDFARPEHSALRAIAALRPPARMTVSQAAAKYRRLDTAAYRGPWRNDVAPYMVEPMDALTSRRFRAAVFVGPARSSKTDSLIMNAILHGGICHPRTMLIVHINKDAARDFSLEKLGPMIQACPDLRSRQTQGRGGDNIFDKRFTGGCRLSVGWPVVGKLSARDIPFVAFTDYDRMDDDIDEEGSPFALGRKRTQTFGSLGMTVVESSPGRPILDEAWSPKSPHEAPPTTGIMSLYNRGTRGRLYWTCPSCGEPFEPTFDRLRWPEKVPASEAAAQVTMACPHHGCVLGPERRNELNTGATWLHETDTGKLVTIDDERIRGTDIVSWWMQGPPACFQSWPELVQRHLEGVEHYDRTGDESAVKATVNLDQGRPYLPRSRGEAGGLSEERLRARTVKGQSGIAPEPTRFITIQVDVQRGRFVVQIDAWGEGLERWLVDRLELHQPPADAPGGADKRALDPARYAEDWDVLLPLAARVIPVGDTGLGLRPVMVSIDSHGEPGVTDRAYAFWRKCRGLGLGARFRLTRGRGGPTHKRAVLGYPEAAHAGRKQVARDVPIITIATDRLKDEISASLTRDEPGPGAYHLFETLDPSVFSELSAERRTDKGWERKAGGRRNEALDLAVYGKALAIVMRAEKIDWLNPPDWARPAAENVFAVKLGDTPAAPSEPVALRRPRRRRVTSSYM
ncbi:MAG: phage terminase large subunit family protein [Reyranella sp.]|uniref:terminase gpA endonuclease subunit n=1 Tax=Reyranella sp. TaxID=1929291 RepID=UPI0025F33C21|nr:terminase gpA endonuclease subunit [Reyranella sp.]MBR2819831.1 phage terminase large subunit family protein [Reyranella sp.]